MTEIRSMSYAVGLAGALALFAYHAVMHVPAPTCDKPALELACSGFYCEPVRRKELPEICSPFYNDGTGRWAECMGVGPKRAPERQ